MSKPNYHTTQKFSDNLLTIEIKTANTLINKLVYLGLFIMEISKIVMHEFWHDYLKSKYREKAKLCYIDTDRFIFYIKTEDIYIDITKMLKNNLLLQIVNSKHYYLKEKIKR